MRRKEPARINYVYFVFIFLCLALISTLHIFLIEGDTTTSRSIFVLEAVGQCLLEAIILLLLYKLIQIFLPPTFLIFFIIGTFFLLIAQTVDGILVRYGDMTFMTGISYLLHEITDTHFIEYVRASRLSLGVVLFIFFVVFVLPLVGLGVFSICQKASKKWIWRASARTLAVTLLVYISTLALWDLLTVRNLSILSYRHYQKALPLKCCFFGPKHETISPLHPLKTPPQKERIKALKEHTFSLKKRPNIYLFVMESLRKDFLTETIAPSLSRFQDENFAFDFSYSNSNCSHISWFSILFSSLPLHWSNLQNSSYEAGSIPLQILKKMGYKIHVYSSARLSYYGMDQFIFGKNCQLMDHSYFFEPESVTADEADRKTIAKLKQDVEEHGEEEGHVHIIFLDSTHYYYCFPNDNAAFGPICNKAGCLQALYSKELLEKVKNRYRNAVHYLDSLFGSFLKTLESTKKGSDAIIAVVGDHGEEFFERGRLFHGSNLNEQQLHVPIIFKFGKNKELPADTFSTTVSSMDIFPSILHYLLNSDSLAPFFDGESIFREKTWPYIVSARYNGGGTPKEFSIQNGRYKLHLKFSNVREVFKSPSLNILSVNDLKDEPVPFTPDFLKQEFGPAIEHLFSPQ